MSLFSRNEASLYYSRHGSALRLWRRGTVQSTPLAEARFEAGSIESTLQAYLVALDKADASPADLHLFVGGSELCMSIVSRVPGVAAAEDWQALARRHVQQELGVQPDQASIAFSVLEGGKHVLVASIAKDLFLSIQRLTSGSKYRLKSVRAFPATVAAWLSSRDLERPSIAVVERGAVTLFSGDVAAPQASVVHIADTAESRALELNRLRVATGTSKKALTIVALDLNEDCSSRKELNSLEWTDCLREVEA